MKKIVIIIIILISFVISLVGFNNYAEDNIIHDKKDPIIFGATYMTLNNPFFKVIDEEIRNNIEVKGDILITLDPELSLDNQIKQIEYLMEQNVKVLFINPVDSMGLKEVLSKAKQKGIYIIAVDTNVYNGDSFVDLTVVSDNYKGGRLCALDMLEKKEQADILILTHNSAKSAKDRIDGFKSVIKDNPNYRIVEEIECEGQLELAMPQVLKLTQDKVYFDVVMSLNDPSALGAIAALKQNNLLDRVLVYGVDGTPEGKMMISEGYMEASVAQYPKVMGKEAVSAAYKLLDGQKPQDVTVKINMISKSNIDEYSLEDWQ